MTVRDPARLRIELTPGFADTFPEGIFGALVARNCPNRPQATALGPVLRNVEGRLRERFSDGALDTDPVAQAYVAYFRRYGGRYPVVHQARTVIAGRAIESPSALVGVMFAAEVESLVLTSGHDLEALVGSLQVDVARTGDIYKKLSGREQTLKPGDMVVRDAEGIIACVLYGPDYRTRLRPETRAALFGAWCPVGLSAEIVEVHLTTLASLLHVEWREAGVEGPLIWRA